MSESLEDFMCKYMTSRIPVLSQYLLTALDSQDKFLCYLDTSLGTVLPSEDIKNCELLCDAGLFREESRINRDGRNRYKLFYLTESGRAMVERMKEESYSEELPESPPVALPQPETE